MTVENMPHNPRVLKELIRRIIDEEFDGSVAVAAREMTRIAREHQPERPDTKGLTRAILYAVLADKSLIKFSHIQIIADYLGIPVGALLFVTRIMASRRDGEVADIEYMRSVHRMLDDALTEQNIDLDLIREIGSGNRQLDLELKFD